jgi:hypothetical protein
MYELRGLDGDVRLVLPSTSSFSGHGIFEDLEALDLDPLTCGEVMDRFDEAMTHKRLLDLVSCGYLSRVPRS